MIKNRSIVDLICSVLVAAGLIIDLVVHLQLAPNYAENKTSTISQAGMFRLEAVVAGLVALIVLVLPWRRAAFAIAVIVGASALGAVMLYRYVNVGTLGPLPNMYEPIWYGKKTVSAFAEAAATLVAAAGFTQAFFGTRKTKQTS